MGFLNSSSNKKGEFGIENMSQDGPNQKSENLFVQSPADTLQPYPGSIQQDSFMQGTTEPPSRTFFEFKQAPQNKMFQQAVQGNINPVQETLPDLPKHNFSQEKSFEPVVAPTELPDFNSSTRSEDSEDIPGFNTFKIIPSFEISTDSPESDFLPPLEVKEDTIDLDWRHKDIKGPLFVRTDKYTEVIGTLDAIEVYVKESSDIIYSLENLKKNMDVENKEYKKTLEDMQRKIIYIDKLLFDRVL